jgi:hypothetical protein
MAATSTACSGPEWYDLALAPDWALAAADADPWPGRPVDAPACPGRTVYDESGSVEIDTNLCSWVSVVADARHDVAAGDPVELLFFHSALVADEPAEAVMGVAIAGTELWTTTVPVPSASGFYAPELPSPIDVAEGDPIVLHVHNHGANTYQLGHLRAWSR